MPRSAPIDLKMCAIAYTRLPARRWNTLRPVAMFLCTGSNEDGIRRKPKSRVDCSISAADRNMSRVPAGSLQNRLCAVINFSSAIAGATIGLMQQMGLLSVEVSETRREFMTWLDFNLQGSFAWALSGHCQKGSFTRCHRVCLARAVAENAVDQVLHSFSTTKNFNAAFDAATYCPVPNPALHPDLSAQPCLAP
jgi:hypothetical protein